jgi:hypothetical protein
MVELVDHPLTLQMLELLAVGVAEPEEQVLMEQMVVVEMVETERRTLSQGVQ